MSEESEPIAGALREIAERAAVPRLHPGAIWRAGRRRRLRAITASATAAFAAVAAAVVVPLAAAGGTGQLGHGPVSPVLSGTAVQFREVAGVFDRPCPPRGQWTPGANPGTCFRLTGTTLTVSRFQWVRISQAAPGRYALVIRLTHTDAARFAALTSKLASKPSPQCQLALIIHGRVVAHPVIAAPVSDGRFQITGLSRAKADNLLGLLR